MPDAPQGQEGGPRFFGRRRGKKLRPTGRSLIETLLPRLAIPQPGPGAILDPRGLFAQPPSALWLEIGFGGGEHLAAQAAAHPGIGFIGCEVFVNGIASLLGHLEAGGQTNVRIFPEDARRLLPALPEGSIERIFVLFPDPWPKKRHAERRFIGPANLPMLARLLADGGELRIATDDPVYQDWAPAQLGQCAWFVDRSGPDPKSRPADWPVTRYEQKALAEGRAPVYLSYQRRPRSA